jgi:hypothetical protein
MPAAKRLLKSKVKIKNLKWLISVGWGATILTVAGCATNTSPGAPHFSTKYRATDGRAIDVGGRTAADNGWKFDEPHLDKCWVAADFDFSGYDTLYIVPTRCTATLRSPSEEGPKELAKDNLVIELQRLMRAKHIIANVVTRDSEIPAGARVLKMENTITQYAQGNAVTRYWIAVGHPKLRVAGKITDGDKSLFIFEGYRSGGTLEGGYVSDVDIQLGDIRSLTTDVTDVMAVVAGKYKPRN